MPRLGTNSPPPLSTQSPEPNPEKPLYLPANLLPSLVSRPARSLDNPPAGARRHLHYSHATVKILRQRPADGLELLRKLRRQHRQSHASSQHPRRILLLQEQNRRRPDRTRHHRLLPAVHVLSPCSSQTFSSASDYTDRKSTRLNSSHLGISYAVFC